MSVRFTGFTDEAEKSLEGQISILQEVGWTAIELRLIDGKNVCDLTGEEWLLVRETLAQAGIAIVGFGGQIANWSRPVSGDFAIDVAELRRVAPRMREANTRFLRIMSYPNPENEPWERDRWKTEVVRRLRELARIAGEEGVVLGHENCSGYGGTADGFLELAAEVDHPAFQLIFDTGNNTLHENSAEASWNYYCRCRRYLAHVHIKGARPGPDGTYVTCHVDEDPVQRRILADLVATGYDGWLSIEPHLKAAVHAGQHIDESGEGRCVWIEYARRLEQLMAEVEKGVVR